MHAESNGDDPTHSPSIRKNEPNEMDTPVSLRDKVDDLINLDQISICSWDEYNMDDDFPPISFIDQFIPPVSPRPHPPSASPGDSPGAWTQEETQSSLAVLASSHQNNDYPDCNLQGNRPLSDDGLGDNDLWVFEAEYPDLIHSRQSVEKNVEDECKIDGILSVLPAETESKHKSEHSKENDFDEITNTMPADGIGHVVNADTLDEFNCDKNLCEADESTPVCNPTPSHSQATDDEIHSKQDDCHQ